MRSTDEAVQHLTSAGVDEDNLLRCKAYIHGYLGKVCDIYDIDVEIHEHKETTEVLYCVCLNQVIEFESELDTTAVEQIDDILDDFDSGGKTAVGNILILLGRANGEKETRNPLITQLSNMVLYNNYAAE